MNALGSIDGLSDPTIRLTSNKRLDEMKKYNSKAAGREREAYLDKILGKKEVKRDTLKHNPTARKEKKEEEILSPFFLVCAGFL